MHSYYLHLGSNQGDRIRFLESAIKLIDKKVGSIISKSSIYETEPWGVKEQAFFLNMAILVGSEMEPNDVLTLLKSIESEIGQEKNQHWGPRNIDIDLLYCDDIILQSDKLNIPHPEIYNRNFVLIPLMEIAADLVDPLKKISIEELYDQCEDEGEVFIFGDEEE